MRLYDKGLIYRGPRLINWSPGLKTAVSDLEVEYNEEQATLYYFKYMLKDSDEFIPVATIRPETILGDTAVAVHPEDERYKKFIGRTALVPMLGREIPVIADDYVSQEFGTGALKITPGHDPNDYDIAQRHHLPVISVLDEAARINENGGPYKGQDRFECSRESVERHEAGRPGDQDRALYDHHPAFAARRRDRGADDLHAVVREDRPAGRRPPWQRCRTAASASCRSASRRSTSTGWRTSRIGASAASCGGDIASRCGTAPTAT